MVVGLVPFLPYMEAGRVAMALKVSVRRSGLADLRGGEGIFHQRKLHSALQTLIVGRLAPIAAFGRAHTFG